MSILKRVSRVPVLCLKLLCLGLLCFSAASHATTPRITLSAQDYFASDEDEKKVYELKITQAAITLHIQGTVIETQLDLTIYNPTEQDALEANLNVPLPEHAMISGYALDIEGVMIDGVMLENKKATLAYEAVVAEKIDPGLLFQDTNNSFSTRIFPVESKKCRKIRVRFTTPLLAATGLHDFRLPFTFDRQLDELTLSFTADKVYRSKPRITLPENMSVKLNTSRNEYWANGGWENIQPQGEVVIQLPRTAVKTLATMQTEAGETFFVINDKAKTLTPKSSFKPEKVTIFWDASLSRQDAHREQELALLRELLTLHEKTLKTIDLVVFRYNRLEEHSYSSSEHRQELFIQLTQLQYDGATHIGSISHALKPSGEQSPSDLYLLFTDGINNYPIDSSNNIPYPLTIVSSSDNARTPYLQRLAAETGGTFFDLKQATPHKIAQQLGKPNYQLLAVTVSNDSVAEIYPKSIPVLSKYVQIYGRLASESARINLHYGFGNKIQRTQSFRVRQAKAPKGNSLSLLWAQQKIAHLETGEQDDRAGIIAVSQEYQLTTAYTSFLVLEDEYQYAEHGVKPPASMPEWVTHYEEYQQEMAEEAESAAEEHVDGLLRKWADLTAWWETDIDLKKLSSKTHKENNVTDASLVQSAETDAVSASASPVSYSYENVGSVSDGAGEEIMVTGIRASLDENLVKVQLNAWSPERPYIQVINQQPAPKQFAEYIQQREEFGELPAFYLDVADFFYHRGDSVIAMQVLSNLLEIPSRDGSLPRVLGYKLQEYNEQDAAIAVLTLMLDRNPDEPQSYRDLALALIARADAKRTAIADPGFDSALDVKLGSKLDPSIVDDYLRAISLLHHVINTPWADAYEGIEMIALMEINRAIDQARKLGVEDFPLDKRLIALLDVDLRVVISWNANKTDIDLWVFEPEPLGTKVFYSQPHSQIGGRISNDMTDGFGPEEYLLKKTIKGKYKVFADFYGSNALIPTGPVKIKADIYLNYGRENQIHKTLMLELEKVGEDDAGQYLIGEIEL